MLITKKGRSRLERATVLKHLWTLKSDQKDEDLPACFHAEKGLFGGHGEIDCKTCISNIRNHHLNLSPFATDPFIGDSGCSGRNGKAFERFKE
jgi:hypothetical protein